MHGANMRNQKLVFVRYIETMEIPKNVSPVVRTARVRANLVAKDFECPRSDLLWVGAIASPFKSCFIRINRKFCLTRSRAGLLKNHLHHHVVESGPDVMNRISNQQSDCFWEIGR